MTEPQERPAIVAAIIVNGGKILLVKRRVQEGSLSWQFPAGEHVPGESYAETAVRETHEEVGLKVEPLSMIGERIHPATGRRMIYVGCAVSGGSATVVDVDELCDLQWLGFDELALKLSGVIYPPVLDYVKQQISVS
jgi:8-oxo-dGTP diphosphatase